MSVKSVPSIAKDPACNICPGPHGGIDFVNGLGADVEEEHHEQNIDTLENNTVEVFFNNLSFRSQYLSVAIVQSFEGLCRS